MECDRKRSYRGGWKQRINAATRAAVSARSRSPRRIPKMSVAASGGLMDWCFGKQSAPALKQVMLRHVLEDKSMGNTTHPMITPLAEAGGKQLGSQNTHRSLMSYLQSMGYAGMVSPAEGRHMRFVIRPHVLIQYYSSRYPNKSRQVLVWIQSCFSNCGTGFGRGVGQNFCGKSISTCGRRHLGSCLAAYQHLGLKMLGRSQNLHPCKWFRFLL